MLEYAFLGSANSINYNLYHLVIHFNSIPNKPENQSIMFVVYAEVVFLLAQAATAVSRQIPEITKENLLNCDMVIDV